MIDDRDYMRQPEYRDPWFRNFHWSWTIALLLLNAVVFIIQLAASHSLRGSEIEGTYFALSLEGLRHGYVWQFLTFQFMHAGWMHLIFNCLAIFFFGRVVETMLGRSRFLAL